MDSMAMLLQVWSVRYQASVVPVSGEWKPLIAKGNGARERAPSLRPHSCPEKSAG
jgi:hypothetical protein